MKNDNTHKAYLIQYIREHSKICATLPLEKFRIEALVIMKVQLEIDIRMEGKEKNYAMIGLI